VLTLKGTTMRTLMEDEIERLTAKGGFKSEAQRLQTS
jgi:hypothetical protein